MTKFLTKAKLVAYLGNPSPREAKYVVLTDETLQNKKSVYQYTNEELILLSNEVKEFTWRTSVATYALLSGVTSPTGMDAIIVLADETHDGQPTQYYYDGYAWVYNGIYFKEEVVISVSEKNTRGTDITLNTDYILPFNYVVGSGHLLVFFEDIELIRTVDFTEVGTLATVSNKIQFKSTIPKEGRLIFQRNIASSLDPTLSTRRGKVDVYYFDTFVDAQNSPFLLDEGQVLRTFGHVTKNDGKGRYWILEVNDKDFGYKNKANTFFINRMICADEVQVGTTLPFGSTTAPVESVVGEGQLVNRADYKRIWAWAVANGRVVTEAARTAGAKGKFSSGDGSTTFRFPNYKDIFLRVKGDTTVDGVYVSDTFQSHWHALYVTQNSTCGGGAGDNTGGQAILQTLNPVRQPISDGVNGTPRVGSETAPKHIGIPYYIKI